MPWFYYVAHLVVRVWLRLFTRWQVKGRQNVPRQGCLLIVANHVNLIDVPLLGVSFDRKVIFLAKQNLFHYPLISYLVRLLDAIPVRRGKVERTTLLQANRVLANGQTLVIFPEGTRSHSGRLGRAFPGAALIALRSGATILPVGIIGTDKVRGVTWILRRPRLTVNIGQPFHLPAVNGKLSRTELAESTRFIMGHIAELLPVEYRGNYAQPGKSDDTQH
ncbi:MAG: 1-acyl-sn-glycerol-3-phosphate acyltransferase [Chloroflexi bacterium]|nr:1-acyl-sn-glycerol-3-phosphate acyltransferase [Chloroflexota bacterium]